MARSSDPLTAAMTEKEEEIWGTWEELLLSCAVSRHRAHSWDSVASEVRSRSPYADLLTADNCRRRYHLLKRRFSDMISVGGDEIDGEDAPELTVVEIPWLDELRKLRVAELRQEVQRYDVSIGSLQSKVKKLKEERERNLRESEVEAGDDAANGPGSGSGSDPKENTDQRKDRTKSLPDMASGDRISGEDSGRSCKESNSTEPKVEEEVKVEERIKAQPDPAVNGSRYGSRYDPLAGAAASYNGSSNTITKGAARSPAFEPKPVRNNSGESVAESKGGDEEEEGTKESSDVQSSASLSRRRRTAAANEPESEAQSTVRKAVDVESQPLIAFLETIRSSKDWSVFDRRLESQESVWYRGLIRRHVDLEMLRKRIGRRSGYTSAEFFRDLLLLCNNALVFYPNDSPESISAVNLRNLINKEIAASLRKIQQPSPQSAKQPTAPPAAALAAQPPLPPAVKPKSDSDRGSAPLENPAPLPPLVACRKRSFISEKPAKPTKKVEKEEKTVVMEQKEESEEDEEEKVVKKSTKQQRTAVSRGLRTNKTRSNGKGGGSGTNNSNPVSAPKPEPVEQETKSGGGGSMAKKKSVADFLNRMKSSSPSSSNGKLVESLKSLSGSRRGSGCDQTRKPSSKEGGKKENASASKRSVGRPPKRAAAPPAKRPREEKTPPLPKKRGRR